MTRAPSDAQRPLAQLLAYINGSARPGTEQPAAASPSSSSAPSTQDLAARLRASYPELPLIEEFKTRWIQLSANRQLEQAQEQVPENAGPLHSSRLVTRSLALMDALSPDYLHTFMAYVDALSWTEQFLAARTQAQAATRAASSRGSGKNGVSTGEKPRARKTTRRS